MRASWATLWSIVNDELCGTRDAVDDLVVIFGISFSGDQEEIFNFHKQRLPLKSLSKTRSMSLQTRMLVVSILMFVI